MGRKYLGYFKRETTYNFHCSVYYNCSVVVRLCCWSLTVPNLYVKTHRYMGFDATCNFRQALMVLGHPLMCEAGRPEHTHQHSSFWNKAVGSPIFSSPLKHFFLYSYIGPFHLLPPSTTNSNFRNTLTLFSSSSSGESLRVLLNTGAEVGPLNWRTLDRCLLPESIHLLFFTFPIF